MSRHLAMSFSKLDQDAIVREALAVLREEGLQGVSLRRVANRLDVSVSALYWHVRNKEALYALMSVAIFRDCLDTIASSHDWRRWLRDFGLTLWDAQIAIKDAHELIRLTRSVRHGDGHGTRAVLAALSIGGLEEETALLAQQSVQALVTGWTTLRTQDGAAMGSDRACFCNALDVLIHGWDATIATSRAAAGALARDF